MDIMRIRTGILFAVLTLFVLFTACTAQNGAQTQQEKKTVDQMQISEYLGLTDAQLVEKKGEGQVSRYDFEGKSYVAQRKYEEKVFGMDAQVEYMFSDDQQVYQIVASFLQNERDSVENALMEALGEPTERQEESDELDYKLVWNNDGVAYTIRQAPDAFLYLIVEAQQ